jgi:hypothetical protein
MAINAMDRSKMQRSLNNLENFIGGGRDIATRAAGSQLARGIRKVLSKKAADKKDHSAPGEAPRRREGLGRKPKGKYFSVYKSIGTQVVEGTMRVGSGSNVARLMEQGYVIPALSQSKPVKARKTKNGAAPRKKRKYPKGRIQKPRPFMAKGLKLAQPKMTDAVVSTLRRRSAGGTVVDLEGASLPGGGRWSIDSGA